MTGSAECRVPTVALRPKCLSGIASRRTRLSPRTALLSTTCLPKMAGSEAGSVPLLQQRIRCLMHMQPSAHYSTRLVTVSTAPTWLTRHTLPAAHPPHRDTSAVAGAVPGSGSVAAPHHAPPPTHAPRAPLCAHGSFSASCSTAPSLRASPTARHLLLRGAQYHMQLRELCLRQHLGRSLLCLWPLATGGSPRTSTAGLLVT